MKVCAYVMTYDTGLAPNPFDGVCTLAVCTPNHQNANLVNGDYIIGVAGERLRGKLGTPDQWRLIYAMKVDERMTLDKYYTSTDYKSKIPKLSGSKKEMCGDNFYKLLNGKLVHTTDTEEHTSKIPDTEIERQDCDGNRVFVGKDFLYFGAAALPFPDNKWARKLKDQLTLKPRGISYIHGGRARHSWQKDELESFLNFFTCKVSPEPKADPIDFDLWKSKPEKNSSCAGCS